METLESTLTRTRFRGEVGMAVTCPRCGGILDCRRAVKFSAPNRQSSILCAKCADIITPIVREAYGTTLETTDGRVLYAAEGAPKENSEPWIVTGRNERTGETRRIELDEDGAEEAALGTGMSDSCSGPCECSIEPDSICSEGWVSLADAVLESCP